MPKELLNEAERFLLSKWDEARMLEESMAEVRSKYKEVFQRIIDAVTETHPELNASAAHVTQFWHTGCIGFGRKSWPAGDENWHPGIWIWNLRLEMLSSEEEEQPIAEIWVSAKSAKKCALDIPAAKAQLFDAAKSLLSPEELAGTETGDANDELLYFASPSKHELLGLLADGDGEKFVERFVTLFDLMARLVPALDKLFQSSPTETATQ